MRKWGSIVLWIAIFAAIAVLIAVTRGNSGVEGQPDLTPGRENTVEEDTTDKYGTEEDETKENGTKAEAVMAPDFTLETLSGETAKLSDYRGKKVIVNFWATWCPYCVMEMPDLEKVDKKLQEDGTGIVLAVNVQEDKEKVEKFIDEKGLSLTVLMDYTGEVASLYGTGGALPMTFFINSDGTAHGYIPGASTEEIFLKVIEDMN